MKVKIGQIIRLARGAKSMSLRKLGEQTGIPHRTICNWENGGGDIGLESFIKIADALGIDWTDIKDERS